MKAAIILFCVALARASLEGLNEDQIRDQMMANIGRERRALCNTVSASNAVGMKSMAAGFAKAFGKRAVNCTPGTGAFADSCDYSRSGLSSKIASIGGISKIGGFGGLSGPILGKRATSDQFENKPNRDIVFIIDDSGSIPAAQFTVAKRGAVTLANSFCPAKLGKTTGTKQVAVVLFSSSPRTLVKFDDSHKGADWLASKINGLPQSRGGTATAAALKHVRKTVLGQGSSRLNDPNTSTHVVVVTDGQCNSGCQDLKEEANALRNMGPGVQLFALGVSNARACELDIITGNGKELAFGIADFNSFESFAKAIKEEAKGMPNGCI